MADVKKFSTGSETLDPEDLTGLWSLLVTRVCGSFSLPPQKPHQLSVLSSSVSASLPPILAALKLSSSFFRCYRLLSNNSGYPSLSHQLIQRVI